MIGVDVTPGQHRHTEALAVVSFRLGCGCTTRPFPHPDEVTTEDKAFNLKTVGCQYPCRRHGDQVITRATQRLAGWAT